jgi:hypothetical protein
MANRPTRFDFSFGGPQSTRGVGDEAPFRILVLADLGAAAALPFAQRKPLLIDIDNFATSYMADGYARASRRPGVCFAQHVYFRLLRVFRDSIFYYKYLILLNF